MNENRVLNRLFHNVGWSNRKSTAGGSDFQYECHKTEAAVYFWRNTNTRADSLLDRTPQQRLRVEPTMKSFVAVILLNLFVLASQHNVCVRPQLHANIDVKNLQRFYNPGSSVALTCRQGFVPILGPRKIVCSDSGEWSKTSIQCIARRCPSPQLVPNGELDYEDTVFQSTINYTCHEGYTITGSNTAECLANGTWSSPAPICRAVQCGLAPIPLYGMIVYDKKVQGNKTYYGTEGTYTCLPPYVLMGEARAACTASGTWTQTPECKLVTCPPPEGIERGFVSGADHKQYGYMETVLYGCHDNFVLDGNLRSICQQDGKWSAKPSCNAACNITIQRGRILYKGKKLWIEDLKPNRMLHNEMVSVYCMNEDRNCSYVVRTQCRDGRLDMPDCFEEPSQAAYLFNRRSLPSEKAQC